MGAIGPIRPIRLIAYPAPLLTHHLPVRLNPARGRYPSSPMHINIETFTLAPSARIVAIVGLHSRELRRIVPLFASIGVEIIDGGAIDGGSNMAKKARAAAAKADVTLLNVKKSRTLKPEDLGGRTIVHFSGIARVRQMVERSRAQRGGS